MKQTIILTFDLELWHEGKWLKPYITKAMENNDVLIESIIPILEILKTNNCKATFFATNLVLTKYPDLIKKISGDGHEIASHSIEHSRLNEINRDEFERNLRAHTELIERITCKKPKGFRAPHFSLNNNTKWVLPILERLNFKYDSSIFPIKTSEYGIRNAPRNIYKIDYNNVEKDDPDSNLIEIPQAVLKTSLGLIPIAGGIYFRIIPLFLFKYLFLKAIRQGSVPMLYFHPHELCAATPKVHGPWLRTLLKYWGTKTSLQKFKNLSEKFKFDSIQNTLKL